jgi:hypothetical protein
MSNVEETNPVNAWIEQMQQVFPWAGQPLMLLAMQQGQNVTREDMEGWVKEVGHYIKHGTCDIMERLPMMETDKAAEARAIIVKHLGAAMLEIYPAILPYR